MDSLNMLREWVIKNFNPLTRLHINQYVPDFMVRRLFESETGLVVSQDEFVKVMTDVGFRGRLTRNRDWVFNISDAEYQKVLRRPK
ncbi:hypothetical protein EXW96_26370 [Paenibacillus sp. JMULE4]|uniref:hypothetical protein n=1 Tax=Paenibacillus sp. JMULE4 TaxID=2518342 RepID=UPI001575CA4C|nr:hypothetical protein [Paenibacillus sp. JMULE4]NTZ20915.1 hypothetical protein [Paenibacillus sp. JMULE4]